ncbi:ParA family protein, partial [Xanthovirga aplysinae]|uniref:ParA family protein n=1 Tax=Xanthovirga aplysinae TaxID=2529853 RepID=UPI0012BC1908
EASLSAGLLSKVLRRERELNDKHLEKLEPVLIKYGFEKLLNPTNVVSVVNINSGETKTTTVASLSKALSSLGFKVLMIDFDPKAKLSSHFGVYPTKINIYHALKGWSEPPVHYIKNNLYLIPSDIDLYAGLDEFTNLSSNFLLKKMVDSLRKEYDYIYIDSGPGLGGLFMNTLIAADELIIPLSLAPLALKGLSLLFQNLDTIQEQVNLSFTIKGILITKYDSCSSEHNDHINTLKNNIPILIFLMNLFNWTNTQKKQGPLKKITLS